MADIDFKNCLKCKLKKPLNEFYKHSGMSNGHLNKCKQCTKTDVKIYRITNIEKVKDYDNRRASNPDRVLAREKYSKLPSSKRKNKLRQRQSPNKERYAENKKKYYEKNKDQFFKRAKERFEKIPYLKKTYLLVKVAVKKGIIQKLPCTKCGATKVQAHHEDYTRPLDVVWYCKKHHTERHIEMRDAGLVWDELGRPIFKEN